MILHGPFSVEPWSLSETKLDLNLLAQSESLFALSNGHIGLRGNLDEGEPYGIPGTYLNSFYEKQPLPYAERGYGFPETEQTLINVTDGKLIRLLVDDAPLDVRYGDLNAHHRRLDLRTGILERTVDWTSTARTRVAVHSRRLVSFSQQAVAAIEYTVEPIGRAARITLQSELVANEQQPRPASDPRAAAMLEHPLEAVTQNHDERSIVLLHRTHASELLLGAGMGHTVEGPGDTEIEVVVSEDWARLTISCTLHPGERLRVVKLLAYSASSLRSETAVRDQVAGALSRARLTGWEGLVTEQRAYLDEFWDNSDVAVEGNPQLQQAVRFGLFHVLQAGARAEGRAIPSKGLTGAGYDGHTFWDTEMFVLPLLTYTHPASAADALRWRFSTLDRARERAAQLNLAGAAFPWRTIRGEECSGYWPAGTAAFHINAAISSAVMRYASATGDVDFERDVGLELLVEIARLFVSLGHYDRDGGWHIDGVTGPDEYSAVADDNVYTNLMAARALVSAADLTDRHSDVAGRLDVTTEEVLTWRSAAAAVHVPYDSALRIHQQAEGFTVHAEWDFTASKGMYPLFLHAPYFDLYRKQVIKQADLILAMHWCGDQFTDEQKARNVDYYERRTVRDSSLSAGTQAILAAEVGHLDLAYDYVCEAAFIDVHDLHKDTRDGLHLASLSGAWLALVAGFGGFRDHGGVPFFDPALPSGLTRIRFSIRWRQFRLTVDTHQDEVTYAITAGAASSLLLRHAGEEITVEAGAPVTRRLRARTVLLPRPTQPPGRSPLSARVMLARPTPTPTPSHTRPSP
ncbi:MULTISPECIES: glycoside hydrolase family 65 protein [unclassified Cryobacterium]|uniref:glycoside hydrolase family 65 protein n=1 Tax=unclassified Cryobacterium TaxID=2649013 RepID=UPI002AB43714|nr:MULTISPECIES: glycosyl hydrolase family 65 protein [unclassified Cryobacterium]MDY7543045.1 glycosyl hydrolase family 65 protein [Cryobacterium sp. 5B3]MEB0000990.1 glycosyl hydrolase family 65 protein [Cryobacterium sp. RTS3]MEB0267636.1 glycosyl hydrolase family 65 protein [Cryobacterium sp. 10I5]MEB0276538.1 glycosyl hydrolase family 65 protein [Cryobacterium sp. 5B3]